MNRRTEGQLRVQYLILKMFKVSVPRLEMPAEESTDLEELEQFAKMFKQKRIKLGGENVQ